MCVYMCVCESVCVTLRIWTDSHFDSANSDTEGALLRGHMTDSEPRSTLASLLRSALFVRSFPDGHTETRKNS